MRAELEVWRPMMQTALGGRIQQALATRCARADITVDRVLEEIRCVAFSDMRDFAAWGPGRLGVKRSATGFGKRSRTTWAHS